MTTFFYTKNIVVCVPANTEEEAQKMMDKIDKDICVSDTVWIDIQRTNPMTFVDVLESDGWEGPRTI